MKIIRSKFLFKLSSLLGNTKGQSWDLIPVISIVILLSIGITAIYAAHSYVGGKQWWVQILWASIGFVIYFIVSKLDYSLWRNNAHWIYYISIILLMLAWSPLGKRHYGAVRWIRIFGITIQPSELAKLGFLVMLAALMARFEIISFWGSIKNLAKFFGVFCIPTILVLLQPDLGSALTFPVMFFAMLYVSNLSKKFFAYVFVGVLILLSMVAFDIYGYRNFLNKKNLGDRTTTTKYEDRSFFPMKDYQRDRIIAFLFPDEVDPDGIGISWNLHQSLIAIGSGGLNGKGFNNGTQAKLGYLPKSIASNDFVFSVIAEERGFVGALTVVLLYALVIWSGLRTANCARDKFGTYLCVGISMLLLAHICINIGMTIGLMPITGIPLPFLSYGGSFLLTCCFLQGLVQSVYRHQNNFT
ncbi:MAG: rod shape-determining protein RodA [Puniceicoccales bacterium]|nr:rod shape-determining protein RodA [Puniceicoccales bacterium]